MGFVWKHWIPAALGFVALLCSAASSIYCESIEFAGISDEDPPMQFGLWQRKDVFINEANGRYFVREKCVAYSDGETEADGPLKTARAFGALACMLGIFFSLFLAFSPCGGGRSVRFCCLPPPTQQMWMAVACLFMTIVPCFQGLALMVLKSNLCLDNLLVNPSFYEDSCSWGGGSTVAALSTALWFVTGASMLILGKPEMPPSQPAETQTVTYQQNTNADGTSTVVETAVVKGVALD